MTWCYWKEWGTKTRVSVWLENHTTLVFIPHSFVQSTVLEIFLPICQQFSCEHKKYESEMLLGTFHKVVNTNELLRFCHMCLKYIQEITFWACCLHSKAVKSVQKLVVQCCKTATKQTQSFHWHAAEVCTFSQVLRLDCMSWVSGLNRFLTAHQHN